MASSLSNIGTLYEEGSLYDSATVYLIRAASILENSEDKSLLPTIFNNLANIYSATGDSKTAIAFHQKSLALFIIQQDSTGIADVNFNLGARYWENGRLDSALFYFKTAKPFYNALNRRGGVAESNNALGVIYMGQEVFDSSEFYLNMCLNYHEETKSDSVDWSDVYLNLAELETSKGNPAKGLELLHKAQQILGKNGGLFDHWYLQDAWAQTYAQLGQYDSAYVYQARAQALNDSIFNIEKSETIAELQTQYEVKLKDEQNATLRAQAAKTTTQRNTFIIISGLLAVLAGFIAYFFLQRAKSRNLIAKQREKLHQQTVQELVRVQEVKVYQSILDGQEQERKRLAAELHDRVGGTLAGLKWQFEGLSDDPNGREEEFNKTRNLIDQTYREVREISHNMAGGSLGQFGIKEAANDLVQAANRPGKLDAQLITLGLEERLPGDIEIAAYRLLQELISNVLKHAGATKLMVQLERIQNQLHITVEDNGQGFDPEKPAIKGMGLTNIENRVEGLKGELNIDSGRGGGTTVMIDIPIS
ncbi:MAG: sensor histidine kinase [Saprospiraceae bacterium]|nr:sensor histidine kinase [Saprospiraceae bacterium]